MTEMERIKQDKLKAKQKEIKNNGGWARLWRVVLCVLRWCSVLMLLGLGLGCSGVRMQVVFRHECSRVLFSTPHAPQHKPLENSSARAWCADEFSARRAGVVGGGVACWVGG